MRTNTRIRFGIYDITAKEDATFSSSNIQKFSNLDALKAEDGANPPLVGTLEEDYFLLDGSFEEFPDIPENYDWGFFSKIISDDNGRPSKPVSWSLAIDFSLPHSSSGLTLIFGNDPEDYPGEMSITWADEFDNLLSAKEVFPNSNQYFVKNKVENYKRVVLRFIRTNKPYRFPKLKNIIFGEQKQLTGTDIISAKTLEEINSTSSEIIINTLQCKIYNREAEFSPLNPKGIFSVLQERQPLVVEEIVDGNVIPMGTYYLDEWNNAEETNVDLTAIDLIGVIDKTNFIGGMFDEMAAGDLVDSIMLSAGVPYVMDESLRDIPVKGHLPICTHREALQQVGFAIGAIINTNRTNKIEIKPLTTKASSNILKSRKFSGGNIRLRGLVTGVDVGAKEYLPEEKSTELFSQTLPAGIHNIVFDKPMYNVDVDGAYIVDFNANRVIIEAQTGGVINIRGVPYVEVTQTFSARTPNLASNISPNIISTDGATLISSYNASNIASSLYDYYQKRFENEFEMITATERVGQIVMIENLYNETLRGIIESVETNLTGGFISKIKVVGMRIPISSESYTGEIYAGERIGVI